MRRARPHEGLHGAVGFGAEEAFARFDDAFPPMLNCGGGQQLVRGLRLRVEKMTRGTVFEDRFIELAAAFEFLDGLLKSEGNGRLRPACRGGCRAVMVLKEGRGHRVVWTVRGPR